MGGTRAVIASLGASISLVAGAALSLLAVSFIFAYDGIVGSVDGSVSRASLRVDAPGAQAREAPVPSPTASATPTLVVERPAPEPASTPEQRIAPERRTGTSATAPVVRDPQPAAPVVSTPAPAPVAAAPAVASAPAAPAKAPKRKVGDGVRDVGDKVADGVRDTGAAVGAVTAPLSPAVSQAVETVIDVIATVVQRAVRGLAGVLDTALSR